MVAIDGPSGVGKSTVGRLLAKSLGYPFLDTGIMYRALTWLALEKGVSPEDEEALSRLAQEVPLELRPTDGDYHTTVDDRNLTPFLRHPVVERWVSHVSRVAGVREALVRQQQKVAGGEGIVMAGRDIGTVVLPHAHLKIFLTATPQERAQRRYRELVSRETPVSYEQVAEDMKRRDDIDSRRAVSPLKPAPDAHVLDTDDLSPEAVVEQIKALIK